MMLQDHNLKDNVVFYYPESVISFPTRYTEHTDIMEM